jgi:hypothetical protein
VQSVWVSELILFAVWRREGRGGERREERWGGGTVIQRIHPQFNA